MQLFTYNVIYDLVDDVRAAMEGRLKSGEPEPPWAIFLRAAPLPSTAAAAAAAHAAAAAVETKLCTLRTPADSLMFTLPPPTRRLPAPLAVEERMEIGTAEVKAVFGSGNRRAAGCMVTDGALRKNCIVEVSHA